ncbi:MAG: FG-GAP-like repeat-containing protein [Saprospiraceae bacterium]
MMKFKPKSFRQQHWQKTYRKLKKRLDRALENGNFHDWSRRKKYKLLQRMRRYAQRLLQPLPTIPVKAIAKATALSTALFATAATPVIDNYSPLVEHLPSMMTLPEVSVTLSPTSVTEDGMNNLVYTFARTGATTDALVVEFEISGTANAASDYTIAGETTPDSRTITIPVGMASADLTITSTSDMLDEPDETVVVSIPEPVVEISFGVSSSNPFGLVDIGSSASPTFADLDDDGDLDAFVGNSNGNIVYFQNDGAGNLSSFASNNAVNPFNGIDIGSDAVPTFADIDDDGDLDAFVGSSNGIIVYFQNDGAGNLSSFAFNNAVNPFNGVDVGRYATPTFADLDNDGDLDAFVGESQGGIFYFQNDGAGNLNSFSSNNAVNPFNGMDVGRYATPTFADLDNDGDLDAFVGERGGGIFYFQNDGAGNLNSFSSNNAVNPFNGMDVGFLVFPSFADLDADGDLDAFIGESNGDIIYFPNESAPISYEVASASNMAIGTIQDDDILPEISISVSPASVEENAGNTLVYTFTRTGGNVGTPAIEVKFSLAGTAILNTDYTLAGETSPGSFTITIPDGQTTADLTLTTTPDTDVELDETVIVEIQTDIPLGASSQNPFGFVYTGRYASPTFADLDSDGDLDAFVGNRDGNIVYFQNNGAGNLNSFSSNNAVNPFNGVDIGSNASPTFADLDDDGDLDAFVGNRDGNIFYFLNDGAGNLSSFATDNTVNPFNGVDIGSSATPTFADLDGDSDLDAFVGSTGDDILYFQNDGAGNLSSFATNNAVNPFNGVDAGRFTSPIFVDIDADGDLDAFIGKQTGGIFFFLNDGAGNLSSFPTNNAVNPFNGIDVEGFSAAPAFADLDNDGDLDAFIGNSLGNITYFSNDRHLRAYELAATIGERSATATIVNDDTEFSITPLVAVVEEGNTGDNTAFTFTVSRVGKIDNAITVDYNITGVANADDFTGNLITGTVSFAANEASKTLTINVNGDVLEENNEDFTVTLVNQSFGTISLIEGMANGRIKNDDRLTVGVTVSPATVEEDDNGTFAYTFTRDNFLSAALPLVVNFSITGTASTADFEVLNADNYDTSTGIGFITIPATETSINLSIRTLADLSIEADETIIVNIETGNLVVGFAESLLNAFGFADVGSRAAPAFADLDDDGDLDAFVGNNDGSILYFQNDGAGNLNSFASTDAVNPFNGVDVGRSTSPTFADLDDDGDLDTFVGEYSGGILYFQNDGAGNLSSFDSDNPFNGVDVGINTYPTFADLDNDGDLDAFVGENQGGIFYFQNDGAGNLSSFSSVNNSINPFQGIDVGSGASPTFADLDEDGDLDAFVGDNFGGMSYFQNDGNGNLSSFATNNASNPFNGVDVGTYSKPAFADLDEDGDLDAFVGESNGSIIYFENISGPEYAIAATTPAATGTIVNDDSSFSIAATDADKNEGNSGTTDFTFTITRAGDSRAAAQVYFLLSSDAADNQDFASLSSGVIFFAANETSKTLTVKVVGDTETESDENFNVVLTGSSSGTIPVAGNIAQGTIRNDDMTGSAGEFAIAASGSTTKLEGNEGATNFLFTITRTGDNSEVALVQYSVTGDVDADDFVGRLPTNEVIFFASGESSKTLTIQVQGDNDLEANEDFTLTIANPTVGTIASAGATAAGTITNDDAQFRIAANTGSANEGNSGTTALTFDVTRTGELGTTLSVDFAVEGDDVNADDFSGSLPTGTLNFAANTTSSTIVILVAGDSNAEADEDFQVVLKNPSLGASVADNNGSATGTIQNDDGALPLDLLSFTGKVAKDQSHLNWHTANERNVAGYHIEWQVNNVKWEAIGYQKATNEAEATYNFSHTQPATGVNYYRLRSVDNDGKETFSNVVALKFAQATTELLVYPNPTKGQFSVVLPTDFSELEPTELMIRDITGRLVYQTQVNGQIDVQLNDLPTGQYVLHLVQGDQVVVGKIVLE